MVTILIKINHTINFMGYIRGEDILLQCPRKPSKACIVLLTKRSNIPSSDPSQCNSVTCNTMVLYLNNKKALQCSFLLQGHRSSLYKHPPTLTAVSFYSHWHFKNISAWRAQKPTTLIKRNHLAVTINSFLKY